MKAYRTKNSGSTQDSRHHYKLDKDEISFQIQFKKFNSFSHNPFTIYT